MSDRDWPATEPLWVATAPSRNTTLHLATQSRCRLGDPHQRHTLCHTTTLPLTTKHWHQNCVQLFLERGANVECRDASKQTPLSRPAANGKDYIVEFLLEKVHTSSPMVHKDNQMTPLFQHQPRQSHSADGPPSHGRQRILQYLQAPSRSRGQCPRHHPKYCCVVVGPTRWLTTFACDDTRIRPWPATQGHTFCDPLPHCWPCNNGRPMRLIEDIFGG